MSVNEGLGYRGPFIVMILFLLIVMAGIVLVNGKMAGGEGNIWSILCGAMAAVMLSLIEL